MTYLCNLISLKDRRPFIHAVKNGTLPEFFRQLTGYIVASASDLGLDDEGRIYKENPDFEGMIFNTPKLAIRNSLIISLFNCIIIGDLSLAGHLQQITIDNCLVTGAINITGNDPEPTLDIRIWKTNCAILNVGSSNIKTLNIGASNIHDFRFYNARCESLMMTSNRIRYFRIDEAEVERCNFFHGQVDLAASFPSKLAKRQREATDIDLTERSYTLLDFSFGADLHSQSAFETISFLRERTLIDGDQHRLSELRYRAALLSQNRFSRVLPAKPHSLVATFLPAA